VAGSVAGSRQAWQACSEKVVVGVAQCVEPRNVGNGVPCPVAQAWEEVGTVVVVVWW